MIQKMFKRLYSHLNHKYCIFSSFSGKWIISGSEDNIWDLQSQVIMVMYYKIIIFFVELQHLKMLIVPLCLDVIFCVSCHPRYGIIASGAIGNDRSVKIWFDM